MIDSVRKLTRNAALLTPVCIAAALPAAAPVSAKGLSPAEVPWVGQYELDVGDGSQSGFWHEHHQSAGSCDASGCASGSATTDEHDADTDALANERLTLRFTPLSVVPTVVLGDVAAEPTGAGVTVGCPGREKSGCTGSVALAIDINEPHSFPAPARTTRPFASARFTLRPGMHKRLHLRIPHASKLVRGSISQAPTVLLVTIGRKHPLRYEGARVRLRG